MAYYPLEFILLSINALLMENKPAVIGVEGTAWSCDGHVMVEGTTRADASPLSVVKSLTSRTLNAAQV